MNRVRRPRPGRAGGQATVELALGLPVVFLGTLLVLQMALVGRDVLLVHHAAREGARAAAVGRPALDGARSASGALDPERLAVDVRRRGGRVEVTVRYQAVTGLPLVGHLVPDPALTAAATMHEEAHALPDLAHRAWRSRKFPLSP